GQQRVGVRCHFRFVLGAQGPPQRYAVSTARQCGSKAGPDRRVWSPVAVDDIRAAMAKYPTTKSIDLAVAVDDEKKAREQLRRCQLELLRLQTDLRDKKDL